MEKLLIHKQSQPLHSEVFIPGSKSESNRALVIAALQGGESIIKNLASSRDTDTMQRLLSSDEEDANVLDAGTTMRFLTAFYGVTGKQRLLHGTPRMHKRPIGLLVDALRNLGCDIEYEGEHGYPPHRTRGFGKQLTSHLQIPGNVSSQYISALLMVAPHLPDGLTIEITGKIGSKPYIEMTLQILAAFGVKHEWNGQSIHIAQQTIHPTEFEVEADWSGASYWYAFASLCDSNGLLLRGVREKSFQGDRVIADLAPQLGVKTRFTSEGAIVEKCANEHVFNYDFSQCPDIAQTVAVICAIKGIKGTFSGLESLKIKETDRVSALQIELAKIGTVFSEVTQGTYELTPGTAPTSAFINTYDDHRMAMAFAPLASVMDVTIEDPHVVRKSYPEFWNEVSKFFDMEFAT